MSTIETAAAVQSTALVARRRMAEKLDAAIVRYDAWFLVFVAVILALGATVVTGMAIYCLVKQGGKTFTGNWSFKDFGLKVYFECR